LAVVVGPNHDAVRTAVTAIAPDASFGVQTDRKGTAHAVRQAGDRLAGATGNVIVLYADTPLVSPATIKQIAQRLEQGSDIVVVGFRPTDPAGYGRLLTEDGRLLAIREHRDASPDELAIGLCNSGIMGFRAEVLRGVIERIGNANAKG